MILQSNEKIPVINPVFCLTDSIDRSLETVAARVDSSRFDNALEITNHTPMSKGRKLKTILLASFLFIPARLELR